jgi:predicted flavoprotein YhiN
LSKILNGIRIHAKLRLVVKNPFSDKEMEEEGELLFKDNGLSGICVFNLSSLLAREKTNNGTVYIDLLPNFTYQQLVENLEYRVKNLNYLKGIDILLGLFHKNIAMLVI